MKTYQVASETESRALRRAQAKAENVRLCRRDSTVALNAYRNGESVTVNGYTHPSSYVRTVKTRIRVCDLCGRNIVTGKRIRQTYGYIVRESAMALNTGAMATDNRAAASKLAQIDKGSAELNRERHETEWRRMRLPDTIAPSARSEKRHSGVSLLR